MTNLVSRDSALMCTNVNLLNRVPEIVWLFSCYMERNVHPCILNGSVSQTYSCWTKGNERERERPRAKCKPMRFSYFFASDAPGKDIWDNVLRKLWDFGGPSSNVIHINEYILVVRVIYAEISVHWRLRVSGCWIRERHVRSPTHKSHNTTILSASEQEVSP